MCFVLRIRRPTGSTVTDTLLPYTARVRSIAVVADESACAALKDALAGTCIEAAAGAQALVDAARLDTDWTMAAIVGCAGLPSTLAALEAGRTVALANKEALVSAGALMMQAAKASGATLLPVDSEHNAIFQCLAGARIHRKSDGEGKGV